MTSPILIDQIKRIREETGVSLMECKKALEESAGDLKRAKEILREKGQEMLKSREGKSAEKGMIASYVHLNGKIGVLLELNCESDFAAQSKDFKNLAHELCLHIAAARPLFVSQQDIPEGFLNSEKKIFQKQAEGSGKPQEIASKIIQGKLEKYKKEVSLLSQPWIKEQGRTVEQLIEEVRAKIGENIKVGKFCRYEI